MTGLSRPSYRTRKRVFYRAFQSFVTFASKARMRLPCSSPLPISTTHLNGLATTPRRAWSHPACPASTLNFDRCRSSSPLWCLTCEHRSVVATACKPFSFTVLRFRLPSSSSRVSYPTRTLDLRLQLTVVTSYSCPSHAYGRSLYASVEGWF